MKRIGLEYQRHLMRKREDEGMQTLRSHYPPDISLPGSSRPKHHLKFLFALTSFVCEDGARFILVSDSTSQLLQTTSNIIGWNSSHSDFKSTFKKNLWPKNALRASPAVSRWLHTCTRSINLIQSRIEIQFCLSMGSRMCADFWPADRARLRNVKWIQLRYEMNSIEAQHNLNMG